MQPQQRPAVGFQQTAPTGPTGAIKVTLQVDVISWRCSGLFISYSLFLHHDGFLKLVLCLSVACNELARRLRDGAPWCRIAWHAQDV